MIQQHIRTKDEPVGGWLGPNTPDPEGRDLFDPEYRTAAERDPAATANGSYTGRDGNLKWSWKKC